MSQPLLTGGFRFLQPDEIEALAVRVGSYPTMLKTEGGSQFTRTTHSPPESLAIDRAMSSPAQQAVFPQTAPQRKLTPNLTDKIRYVVHYRNLKLYLQLGLVVTRIHRVLAFKQSTWLKTYIDFNTHQRSLARSSFLKDVFKLMNNSVFGKTREYEETCTG